MLELHIVEKKGQKFSNGTHDTAWCDTQKAIANLYLNHFFSVISQVNILLIKREISGIQDAYRYFHNFQSNHVEIKSVKTIKHEQL